MWVQKSVKERESKEKEIELKRRERVLTEAAVVATALTAAVAAAVELFCCVFTMGLCRARWEGAAFVGFGLGF